jgi:hypothetical protein
MPTSPSASFTSSSLNGLMIASTFFMVAFAEWFASWRLFFFRPDAALAAVVPKERVEIHDRYNVLRPNRSQRKKHL